jgi:hypothetical protein
MESQATAPTSVPMLPGMRSLFRSVDAVLRGLDEPSTAGQITSSFTGGSNPDDGRSISISLQPVCSAVSSDTAFGSCADIEEQLLVEEGGDSDDGDGSWTVSTI